MNVIECIETRRSIRKFNEKKISRETINKLIELGTLAPTSMGKEPWGFVVIQDKEEINRWSEKIKTFLLENLEQFPYLKPMETILAKPDFSVFNSAENMIVIYGNTQTHYYTIDCTLASQNIMLAANSMEIGTCWIGFSQFLFDNEEFKKQYHVPEEYKLVSTIILGYHDELPKKANRKPAIIFNE
ncbi:MAG: nitroreductase family protein [Lachnospiraceae bacterium]